MAEIRSLLELSTPDPRSLHFSPLGLSPGASLKPEDVAHFQQAVIAHCDLVAEVAEGTRMSFERIRMLHGIGVLCYEAYTVAEDLAWLVLEQALRERFIEEFNGSIPLINAKTKVELPIVTTDYGDVDNAFHGGSHQKGGWQIPLASGSMMDFRGSMADLQSWARREGLLDGQRNKLLDAIYVEMRNARAHPQYRLSMPPASARVISDLAEIINRLWGHYTPGGRLYPAPLEREILAVAWNGAEAGTTHVLMRDYQLDSFDELGEWECLIVEAVFEDVGVWEFDAQYERTNYPTELLWGPGTPSEAKAWLSEHQPVPHSASYLDRFFALRIANDRVSLARRPEVALAVPETKRDGRWIVVRADFPLDAFNHGRHINNGIECSTPKRFWRRSEEESSPSCAVEPIFDGTWSDMAIQLHERYGLTAATSFSTVCVAPSFHLGVAPDVEDD
jgi:hypothetical protein